MAQNDSSSYLVRFNEVTQTFEYATGPVWVQGSAAFTGGTVPGTVTFAVAPVFPVTTAAGTGTVTPIATTSSQIDITVTGALTLNGPAGGVNAQKITFRLTQDGTGHTVTFATGAGNFSFGTTIPSFTASGASLTDYVGVIFNSTSGLWNIVSVSQGF